MGCQCPLPFACAFDQKEAAGERRTIGRVVNWYVPPSSSVDRGGEVAAGAEVLVSEGAADDEESAEGVVAVRGRRRSGWA